MDFDDKTEPGTRSARHRRISSQQDVDAVELLLGQLDAEPVEALRRKLVRAALQKAFDRGQAVQRVAAADVDVELARERSLRHGLESRMLDINGALMAYERDQAPDAYQQLREAIIAPLPKKKERK